MSSRPGATDAPIAQGARGPRALPALRIAAAALLAALVALGTTPPTRATGAAETIGPPEHRLRIAYYQGGDYSEYHDLLVATAQALAGMGLIDASAMPEDTGDRARPIWEWLVRADDASDRVEFLADGFYSAEWDDEQRAGTRLELLHRLRARDDVDLVLAFGTWAGKDLANDQHSTPTLVISASDAVGAGIVASVEDSGFDHIHAHLDPDRIERQVRLFHEAVGFESLGVAYEDTPAGHSYAGIRQIETLAAELGFEVVACHTLSDIPDEARAEQTVLECFGYLVGRADALYLTEQGGVTEATLPEIARLATHHRTPTFSQRGTEDVRFGVLLSMARGASLRAMGSFHAETLIGVSHGRLPRELPQVFEIPTNFAINLETARAIGYVPSSHLLVAADEFYGGVETGN